MWRDGEEKGAGREGPGAETKKAKDKKEAGIQYDWIA